MKPTRQTRSRRAASPLRLVLIGVIGGLSMLLTGCSKHPLAGGWHEHAAGGGEGLQLEFDPASDRLQVHGRPRPDGGHDDLAGTYKLDGAKLEVQWTDTGKVVKMTGTVLGDAIELVGADGQKIEFHAGAAGHKH